MVDSSSGGLVRALAGLGLYDACVKGEGEGEGEEEEEVEVVEGARAGIGEAKEAEKGVETGGEG